MCLVVSASWISGTVLEPGGSMNFHWMYANKFLLIVVASTVPLDGVLTTLVIHQQHNQSTINGQATPRTAAPVPPAARMPALASPLPQWTPSPHTLVASPPRIITPPLRVKTKTVTHRRVDPISASPPLPQSDPVNSVLVKPGAPPEISNPSNSARSNTVVKPGAPPEIH
jgi:hypothetical protein